MPAPRTSPPLPTDAELGILQVLWDTGPASVAEVQERLPGRPGYTSVLKFLQIMLRKKLVSRDEGSRRHVYAPRVEREITERRLVGDLAKRAFGGSAARMALQALSTTPASAEELAEIRTLLGELEAGKGKGATG